GAMRNQIPRSAPESAGTPLRDQYMLPARAAKSATIGIISSLYPYRHDHLELNNYWVTLMVQTLEQAFSRDGHVSRFINRVSPDGNETVPLKQSIETALAEGVDALMLVAFGMEAHIVDDALAALDHTDLPVVCITSGALRRPMPHVFFNNHSAGYQAGQFLLRQSSKPILFLTPFSAEWQSERLGGVLAAAEHSGMPASSIRVLPRERGSWVQEEDPEILGYKAAMSVFDELMAQGPASSPLPNVICINDGVAFGLLRAASERGLSPGRDFLVVSFDDHPQSRVRHLTSVRPPMEQMGREAARMLLAALQGEHINLQVCLRWQLIPRGSTVSLAT
ncbi:MAG TPA: LacI family DNA-binding transcriptional regulator, partial [Capsulimonadaceae bacterium]|nr:LacI family DNA-binding transcriptional regulator [Capsulimonadaceae bacterium]